MGLPQAIDKYDWVKDYMWNAVPVDTDKYTAKTALGEPGGYFIRLLPKHQRSIPNPGLYVYR